MKEEKDILFKHATRISVVCNFEHKVHNENNHITGRAWGQYEANTTFLLATEATKMG